MNNVDVIMTVTNPSTWAIDPRVMKEAKALVDSGFRVMVIGWDREGYYPPEEIIDNIKIKRINLKSKYGNIISVMFKIPHFYFRVIHTIIKYNFKIIHTHDFDTAIIGFFSKYILRKKWIYDAHDLYFTFFSMNQRSKNIILAEIIKKIDVFFAKRCDALIVPTEKINGHSVGIKEYYTNADINERKIITIWNTPDIDSFLNYKKLNLQKSEKYTIGYIGHLRTIDNFVKLFNALKDRPSEYKVLFVGRGIATEKLKKIVEENYPNLEVEFFDSVDYKIIPNYYKLCDVIFAYHPMRENVKRGVPVKAFESSILGIPLIVNANTLAEDFVRKYKCGIGIDSLTRNKIIAALKKLKELKFNPAIIRKYWNWKEQQKKLIKCYNVLLLSKNNYR